MQQYRIRKWLLLSIPITIFLFCLTYISCAQTDEQIQKIYDFYAAKDVCYEREVLYRIEEFTDIHNDSLQKIVFDKLYRLIQQKPNKQVKALVLAVDAYRHTHSANNRYENFDPLLQLNEAVKIALNLNNELLLAKIYAIYGHTLDLMKQPQDAIFYLKRSNNIISQSKDKGKTLVLYETSCYDLTQILYRLFEYENCIAFGKKYLQIFKNGNKLYSVLGKVQVLDLVGASYKWLGKADSSILYYQNILSLLKEKSLENLYMNELWTSIAYGNIGENLLNQGNMAAATPYIEQYFNFNQQHQDLYNILLSSNLMARLYVLTGKNNEAKMLWKYVLNDSLSVAKPDLIINASNGLSQLFAKSGLTDSALFYNKIATNHQAAVQRTIYQSGLKAAEKQIAFEKMESSLNHSNDIISKIKLSRNLTILSLVLLMALVAAFSFWRHLNLKYKLKEEGLRNQMAAQQIEDSKQLLYSMTQSLVEKTEIVEQLSGRLNNIEKTGATSELREQVAQFAFTKEDDWQRFLHSFERVYPDFVPALTTQLSNIFPAELRLSVLMKVGLTNAQIAASLGISPGSVSTSKYRLKQKLELDGEQNLENYIRQL